MEEWKKIIGKYEVSTLGRIRNSKKLNLLKLIESKCGYLNTNLYENGNSRMYLVHRLVAEAFIPNPDNKPCVDHINGNRQDNRVENLRWCTHKENNNNQLTREKHKHLQHTEMTKKKMSESRKGRKIKQPINNRKSKKVYQYTLDGVLVKIWPSTMECARNGFNQGEVAACCRGGIYKNGKWVKRTTYKGYRWSYIPL